VKSLRQIKKLVTERCRLVQRDYLWQSLMQTDTHQHITLFRFLFNIGIVYGNY
jgi:hypothetical protein